MTHKLYVSAFVVLVILGVSVEIPMLVVIYHDSIVTEHATTLDDGTTDLWNATTLKQERIPYSAVLDKIRSGLYGYHKDDRVNVIGPSGTPYTVSGTDALDALSKGYRLETTTELHLRKNMWGDHGFRRDRVFYGLGGLLAFLPLVLLVATRRWIIWLRAK